MVIAKLSLNNPSNIWHCSKEICHTTTDRERERAGERERASWMPNAMVTAGNTGTTGWISLIGFACSVNVHNSICLVYAKFNELSCMVPGYRFRGGPIALQCFVHISDKKLQSSLQPFCGRKLLWRASEWKGIDRGLLGSNLYSNYSTMTW